MGDAVVVELDRELRSLEPERLEQLAGVLDGLDPRQRLFHPPESDPVFRPLEPHRHDSHARLEPYFRRLQRRPEDERRSQGRMAGEWELRRRCEDPDPRVPALLRR